MSEYATLSIPCKGKRCSNIRDLVVGQICVYDGRLPGVPLSPEPVAIVRVEAINEDTYAIGVYPSVTVKSARGEKYVVGGAPTGVVPLLPIMVRTGIEGLIMEEDDE